MSLIPKDSDPAFHVLHAGNTPHFGEVVALSYISPFEKIDVRTSVRSLDLNMVLLREGWVRIPVAGGILCAMLLSGCMSAQTDPGFGQMHVSQNSMADLHTGTVPPHQASQGPLWPSVRGAKQLPRSVFWLQQ